MDIGWYRTLIRSFEREVYIVPNSVFSRTVVLNVTRKGKEWRVYENIGVRVEDIAASSKHHWGHAPHHPPGLFCFTAIVELRLVYEAN